MRASRVDHGISDQRADAATRSPKEVVERAICSANTSEVEIEATWVGVGLTLVRRIRPYALPVASAFLLGRGKT
jgi:hypothetical protein